MVHPDDAASHDLEDGSIVRIGNRRGDLRIHVKIVATARRGVLIAEGLWPNGAHI